VFLIFLQHLLDTEQLPKHGPYRLRQNTQFTAALADLIESRSRPFLGIRQWNPLDLGLNP
jgi:hypothetical protein